MLRNARLLAAFLSMIFLAVPLAPSIAADISQATLERLAADEFSETATAIAELAASGAPNAQAILDALTSARLFFDPTTKKIYIRATSGSMSDAATGDAVTPAPTGLQTVRVNNRLRGAIENALGTLTLLSPDPARRRAAADSLFKSRDVTALPALETALKAEQDIDIQRLFAEARAAILLAQPDTSHADIVDSITLLKARGDISAIATLRSLPDKATPDVRQMAGDAIASIERRLKMLSYVQNVWYGLSLGSVLLLAAIGLAITFGVMGVINMAHGEMVMIGAYTTFVVQDLIRTRAPHLFDWSLPIALPLAFVVAGLIGIVIERGIIRFLYGRPLETLLATWGVSLILQQAVRTIFGPNNREVGAPSYMSGAFDFYGLSITWGRMWIIVFTLCVFFALLAALKWTSLGLYMRAVTQNRRMAGAMGIRTPMIDALTFGLGSGLAGIAGVALSQIDNVSPNLGQSYIIDSFMVVVFGGVGNLWGTLVSALALGVANKFLEPFAGAVLAKIFILVLLILFIQKRPRGLFALKGRAVEA
ncbi:MULTISPECIES: urea ABC transporter permease subunit UrtB [unclassified Beijerinckia]|uniref:urea ABC transporter permease subunit UrtB n=1 Tax=unclassified Beijerinckia TaxID=2638183 RepID=UPI0008970099|nr:MULTISPECIES: urea ABC transporter permease subunit UrtB [unclassified Beijerinckia]MDH7797639.1 urea transport system permease protein [Beijerinckia sp. GAS462]SEC93262.1 amino acid/amide ABC transporter membrane protein 1, HAAT family [Beijerinckia sp. 28-YEA-48]